MRVDGAMLLALAVAGCSGSEPPAPPPPAPDMSGYYDLQGVEEAPEAAPADAETTKLAQGLADPPPLADFFGASMDPLSDLAAMRIDTRTELARTATELPEGPYVEVLTALAKGSPEQVGYFVGPDGRAFGVGARGGGPAFTEATAGQVKALLDPKMASVFETFAHFGKHGDVRFEMVLGDRGWMRAGVRGLSEAQVRVALEEEQVPADEIERVLAYAADGEVLGIDVLALPPNQPGLVVVTRLDAPPDDLPDGLAMGIEPILVETVVGSPDKRWVRRPGLPWEPLIDWQTVNGADRNDAPRRLAKLKVFLETDGVQEIVWEPGKLGQTAVYGLWFRYRAGE